MTGAKPGPHDVQIDILYCGVCHSDLHQIRNEWGNTVYPCLPGHEIVGRVLKAGQHVTRFKEGDLAAAFVSVQSVVVDPVDRLWILDTGSPLFQPTQYGGPKLVCVDLASNQVIKKILFPQDVVLPTTYRERCPLRFAARQRGHGLHH